MTDSSSPTPESKEPSWSESDRRWMRRALELARRGEGYVEPNPMVGCVIAEGDRLIGEGWHQRFGGPHAEVEAILAAGTQARSGTLYVTLEPCCHHGKTPPCTEAILAAGVPRVVVAQQDPFPLVDGGGVERLRQAGVEVSVGLLAEVAREITAPFSKLVTTERPWLIAKWAMSLDGKIATRIGDSRWISNETSRRSVHQMRGRVDAILVGRGTVEADDPLLTARPAGARTPTRIVLDSLGTLGSDTNLVRTARDVPVLVVASAEIAESSRRRLIDAGCEVLVTAGPTWQHRLHELLDELGRRKMTNVLIEGGAMTLGGFFDQGLIDELHVFVSPRVIGGHAAPGPVAGQGVQIVAEASSFSAGSWELLDGDLHYSARRSVAQSLRD